MRFLDASAGSKSPVNGQEMLAILGIKNASEMTVQAAKIAVRVARFGDWALNS